MALHKDLIDIIDTRIKAFLSDFIYTTEKIGQIKTTIDTNGKYMVNIEGVDYSVPKKNNDNTDYQINDIVLIRLSNGNFSRKYIECKKPNR